MWGCGGGFRCSAPQYGRGRGGRGGTHTHTHTHTHTQEHTQERTRECCTYPLATYPLKSARIFLFSPGLLCNSVRKWPQNVEKIARFPGGEKNVESCHVCGCHGFFAPEIFVGFKGGTEKVPQRTCETKILPNFWLNFLV